MQNTFRVQIEGESLVARLVENGGRRIELTYGNKKGDFQVGVYINGMEVSKSATMAGREYPIKDSQGDTFLRGYLAAYRRLGPKLREQIPSDWHVVLGGWLAPKK